MELFSIHHEVLAFLCLLVIFLIESNWFISYFSHPQRWNQVGRDCTRFPRFDGHMRVWLPHLPSPLEELLYLWLWRFLWWRNGLGLSAFWVRISRHALFAICLLYFWKGRVGRRWWAGTCVTDRTNPKTGNRLNKQEKLALYTIWMVLWQL